MASHLDLLERVLAGTALAVLGTRALLRIEGHWDALWYHLPFAAHYGAVPIPFEMQIWPGLQLQGFPPLPYLLQGWLWLVSGTPHATQVVNLVSLLVFLRFCSRTLGAAAPTVLLIALSAPLVWIHASSGYPDLFGGSFLAIAVGGTFACLLARERHDPPLLQWILIGAVLACWSRMQALPIAAAVFLVQLAIAVAPSRLRPAHPVRTVGAITLYGLAAAVPYAKNLSLYGNPLWPIRVPGWEGWFSFVDMGHVRDWHAQGLEDPGRVELFVRSLFEIGIPVEWSGTPRYVIDMAASPEFYLMGGFWGAGAVAALAVLGGASFAAYRSRFAVACGLFLGLLALNAALPQSNELRYWIYLPLTWAALIGMSVQALESGRPRLVFGLRCFHVGLFLYISVWNWTHWSISPRSFADVARERNVSDSWARMEAFREEEPRRPFCIAQQARDAILYTGPTLSEFAVVSREFVEDCPAGAIEVRRP